MNVGIIGCGQLARMLAQAAARLDVTCTFVALGGENTTSVDGLGHIVPWSPGDDTRKLYLAMGKPSLVTVEREAVDVDLLHALQSYCQVAPPPESVLVGQNRGRERALLDQLDIPCAPHRVVTTVEELTSAVDALGLPLVLKACEAGYDGKLQWRFHSLSDVDRFCAEHSAGEWLLEKFIDFDREVSIVAARSSNGEFSAYPLTENHHRDGILLASIAPARKVTNRLQQAATGYIQSIMTQLDYVGVMAAEFFEVDGALLVNELAPRVHNSGHWTMQDGIVSQFENHMRAILGMPLGATHLERHVGMMNILGSTNGLNGSPDASPAVQLHLYNKAPAPLRKLGHLNVAADSQGEVIASLSELHDRLYGAAYARLELFR